MKFRFFASARDAAGVADLVFDLGPGPSTVSDALARLSERSPGLGQDMGRWLSARNQRFAKPGDALEDGDEIAIFPPVSGG